MITSMKYMPVFVATIVMMISYLSKVLFTDFRVVDLFRDMLIFFIVYYVVKLITSGVERILKSYWKIL